MFKAPTVLELGKWCFSGFELHTKGFEVQGLGMEQEGDAAEEEEAIMITYIAISMRTAAVVVVIAIMRRMHILAVVVRVAL